MRHALWLVVLAGCGPEAVIEASRCLKVGVPIGRVGVETSLPSRVSLAFSVDGCDGAPISGLDAASFDIAEDGRSVSTFESQRRVTAQSQAYRMNSLVLLDLSGSVLRSGQFPALRDAAQQYVTRVLAEPNGGQRVAVMTFDGREAPQPVVGFTADAEAIGRALAGLEQRECRVSADCAGFTDHRTCAGWRCVDDSTNLNGAVVKGLDVLDAQLALETSIAWKDAVLVVFTDGTDQASRTSQLDALQRARSTPSHVFTVGLGGEVDDTALRGLGKDGHWPVAKAEALGQAFTTIATRVTGMANRFYTLDYCSPKRSGTHSLRVTATLPQPDGTRITGSLTRDFDATGFTSGCEL